MAKKLLTDWTPFEYSSDMISESRENNNGKVMMKGVLQKANTLNQNGRVYPLPVLEREVRNYQKFIKENRALGECDHPESSVVELKNVSHIVREASMRGDDVYGVIEILNTPDVNPGTRIDTTVGDHYSITEKNSQELIQFHKDETIGGHYKLFINQQGVPNQHFTIQVGAGSNVNLQIDQGTLNVLAVDGINFQTGGDFNLLCSNLNTTVLGNKTETILGAYEELVSGTNTKTGTPLKLN